MQRPLPPQVYKYLEYKVYLADQIKYVARTGYKGRIAKAMGTPSSFVSQLLHSNVHLSLDHALRLSRFLEMSNLEKRYFLTLVQLARAGSIELREYLKNELNQIKGKSENLSDRFQKPSIETDELKWQYYSSWHLGAIHMALTVKNLNTAEKVAEHLNVPLQVARQGLEELNAMNLVNESEGLWKTTKKNIHLSKDSPVSPLNHFVWRQKATMSIYEGRSMPQNRNLHYSALYSLDRRSFEKIRDLLMQSIDQSRSIVEPAPEEEIGCLNLDWFKLG